MELVFLKRNTNFGRVSKLTASLNNKGSVQLTKGCSDEFGLEQAFHFGRIALNKGEEENPKSFYLVEETNQTAIEGDISVVKMIKDNNNGSRRFTFGNLAGLFAPNFKNDKGEERKSIYFSVKTIEVLNNKVLQFTINE